MWLTRFSIQRPIIVAMFFIGLAVFGSMSYLKLGKNAQPNVAYPIVIVFAGYPGASPAEMERLIIKPIEDQIDGIQNLDQLTATAQDGTAVVIAQFKLGTDLDFAAIDVQRRVDTARIFMPSDLDPPSVEKNGAEDAILTYAVSSKSMSGPALADLMNDRVLNEIRHIPNVSNAQLYGDATREFQVETDPLRLMGVGATLSDVFSAIAQNNANLPGGRIDRPTVETDVSIHADVNSAADIAAVPLTVPGQSKFLTIGNVANVIDGHHEQRRVSHINGSPGLFLDISRYITADEIASTNTARVEMKKLAARFPQVSFKELFAPADYTKASLNGVFQSLFEGVLLTAIVLMLFLHAWRNAVVVMIAIPSSLLATFVVMRVMGLTLDNVSLMGLSLIIGILVDDSIVVLENITRHRDMGQSPGDAAISGRTEIGGAAIAITLVDVVVFLPLAFLSGFVGKYMQEFGIVVVVATLFSLFVSFTLTPMLAAKWSIKRRSAAPPWYLVWFQRAFDSTVVWYRDVGLPLALRHRWMTFWLSFLLVLNALMLVAGKEMMMYMAIADGVFAVLALAWGFVFGRMLNQIRLVGGIYVREMHAGATLSSALVCLVAAGGLMLVSLTNRGVQSEFVPSEKRGQVAMTVTFPTGTPLGVTQAAIDRLENAALKLQYVDTVRSTSGQKPSGWGSTTGGFVGQIRVTLLKDHRQAEDDLIDQLRKIVAPLAKGAQVQVSVRGGGGSGNPVSYTLSGPDGAIDGAADKLAAYIRTLPGTVNVQTGAETAAPHLTVRIDPGKAAILGVSPGAAATAARVAVGGAVATKVRTWNGLVDVRLEYPASFRNSLDQIKRIPVRDGTGAFVPLASVATFTEDRAPTKIQHVDRQRVVAVSGDLDRSRTTLGEVIGKVNSQLAVPGFLPPGVQLQEQGDSQLFSEFLGSMAFALLTSFALIYMLMVILYGSFLTPFVIMFSIPVAIIGALLALTVTHQSINLFSGIGIVMLIGLVAKNGILLVDYANTLRKRGLKLHEAMITAGGTRLRPIVMTTAAMVFGMLPLATGHTEGGEIRMSMGIVLIGGLLSSLFLTLFLVPAMYLTVNKVTEWFADRRARRSERRGEGEEPLAPPRVPAGAMGD
jgi:HAE1 family hydrophobic/amphiphilic exporter-1